MGNIERTKRRYLTPSPTKKSSITSSAMENYVVVSEKALHQTECTDLAEQEHAVSSFSQLKQ